MRQQATKYCHWEVMFIVWAVYASLSAAPLTPLPFISNGPQAHRFIPTTVLGVTSLDYKQNGHQNFLFHKCANEVYLHYKHSILLKWIPLMTDISDHTKITLSSWQMTSK
jgi:hypothetical protein